MAKKLKYVFSSLKLLGLKLFVHTDERATDEEGYRGTERATDEEGYRGTHGSNEHQDEDSIYTNHFEVL